MKKEKIIDSVAYMHNEEFLVEDNRSVFTTISDIKNHNTKDNNIYKAGRYIYISDSEK